MVEKTIQITIAILTSLSILFTQLSNDSLNELAPLIGLSAQPFWFYETYIKKQWGMFIVTIFTTMAWIIGIL